MDENKKEVQIYKCERCGYETADKYALIKHLNRKNKCNTILSDISCEELLQKLEKKYVDNAPECPYCNSKFNYINNMYAHKKYCKKRPGFVESCSKDETETEDTSNVNSKNIDITKMDEVEKILTDNGASSSKDVFNVLHDILGELKSQNANYVEVKPVVKMPKPGYIYIVHTREFLTQEKPIYKIGRSKDIVNRLRKGYASGSQLLYHHNVFDQVGAENKLKDFLICDPNIIRRREFGIEFFEGDISIIEKHFHNVANKFEIIHSSSSGEKKVS